MHSALAALSRVGVVMSWRESLRRWFRRRLTWLRRPLACKLGRHAAPEIGNWGFGGSVIDWYCVNCEAHIGFTALDDASPELLNAIEQQWGGKVFDL